MLGGVKASTPAARSLLDPACAPGGPGRRSAPRNGPSVSPRNTPEKNPLSTFGEGAARGPIELRDQKPPKNPSLCLLRLTHRRYQRHHRGEIDLTAQKAQRCRRGSLATTVHRAAEAEALAERLTQTAGTATWFALKPRRMEDATTCRAACRPGASRDIAIELEKLFMELGISQHCLIQGILL